MPDQRDTLALAFERGLASPQGRWLFLNAAPLPGGVLRDATCEQPFRADHLALAAAGYDTAPAREAEGMDGGALLLGRSRRENERNLARLWNALRPGGTLVVAGDKTAGIAPLRKLAGARTAIVDTFAKHHATAFVVHRDGQAWPVPEAVREADGFAVPVGGFSADGPDPASRLLARHLDGRPLGRTADLGAGWGYLAREALARADVRGLAMFEADHVALEAARANVPQAEAHWHDVALEPIRGPYDSVVMNPPFHAGSGGRGRASRPGLGQSFIERAGAILRPGGRLLMVANRNLPYERTLAERFRSWSPLADEGGFKVLEGIR